MVEMVEILADKINELMQLKDFRKSMDQYWVYKPKLH